MRCVNARAHTLPEGFPARVDADDLARLEGEDGPLRYRWDEAQRVLLFGRRMNAMPGERGAPVGLIRVDATGTPSVHWHTTPLTPVPLMFLLALTGLGYFAVVEGQPIALAGVVPVAAMLALLRWILQHNGRGTLERQLLPRLADLLRRADGTA